jgi:folate-binding protein YgfZ
MNVVNLNGIEAIADYGDYPAELDALSVSAGLLDLSGRGRICLTGADRVRFLHGQVTNDIKQLAFGQGCYAALVTAKGRMQSDLNVYYLAEELLLDFEPGFARTVTERLEHYIVADDVQVVDVAPHYGLLSVQGPQAASVFKELGWFAALPPKTCDFSQTVDPTLGELYLSRQPRSGTEGFDLFVPTSGFGVAFEKLTATVQSVGGRLCGWRALETSRIEAGIPRFGADMDESNLPQECGIENRAVSYNKGCYIGQEVLNRVHTMGHVNRELRGLALAEGLESLPQKGDKLLQGEREFGFVTSSVHSPRWGRDIALGYVRREMSKTGTQLTIGSARGNRSAVVVDLPFNFEQGAQR